MDKLFDTADLQQNLQDILVWTQTHALNLDSVVQRGMGKLHSIAMLIS